MSYIFFQDVVHALGKKINYDSISNMYGRTVFDKKGGEAINKMIAAANPLVKPNTKNSAHALLALGGVRIIESGSNQKQEAQKALGDMSWFEDYLK